jgi:hypothetical protein
MVGRIDCKRVRAKPAGGAQPARARCPTACCGHSGIPRHAAGNEPAQRQASDAANESSGETSLPARKHPHDAGAGAKSDRTACPGPSSIPATC